jgi:arylsulfatase A-like enzyme
MTTVQKRILLSVVALLAIAGVWALSSRQTSPPSISAGKNGPKPVPTSSVPTTRPNVVLISIDTTRADHLGCYGYPKPTTPNLDRWAKRSVLFRNCRSQAPWTLPSHMSAFTSLTPTQHSVDNLNMILPPSVPMLAELLQEAGYQTAALVNNGQMKAHWGFSRGFDTWREFEVDTPQGNCDHITSQALAWLAKAPRDKPHFLFLHYYDAHDPYSAPDEFRKKMGTTLSGDEARELCVRYRTPQEKLDRPQMLDDVVAAYDAEIAWLDSQLERLLSSLPEDTLVVLFADHGESFKEHGWMLHGATLFDEETHVPLILRLPGQKAAGTISDESVMLLDLAPTILMQCGVKPPAMQQGRNLAPLWQGGADKDAWAPRIVPAETKAVLEGRLLYSATLFPLKGIYSVLDSKFDVFRLPDEQHPLTDPQAKAALEKPLRELLAGEQFWLLQATGKGDFSATLTLASGSFGLFIPVDLDLERDNFSVAPDGKNLTWQVHPRGTDRVISLLFKPSDPNAKIECDLQHNGEKLPSLVFLGPEKSHPEKLPLTLANTLTPVDPWQSTPFAPKEAGFYVRYFRGANPSGTAGHVSPLDEKTIRQLESLGYLRKQQRP